MDWIAWDDTLKTGHADMDADHKELARLFELLRDAVEGGKKTSSCLQVFDEIVRHAQSHFERERELMELYRYPKADRHGAEHAMLIRQAQELRARLEWNYATAASELASFPDVWLGFHILFSDKELAAFLARSRGDRAAN